MNYKGKLRDPRWQKKKSEIMMRDNFTCQQCGATEKTLNVHHITYIRCKNGEPWSCPDEDLITLCEDCHSEIHSHPDIPFPFDEEMTKEAIRSSGLEPYEIIGDFINRDGLFKYYKAPFSRIIEIESWANEWGAVLEFSHYSGEFLGNGFKELVDAGWDFIWGTSTLYENKRIPWDEESLDAYKLEVIKQDIDTFGYTEEKQIEVSDIKKIFVSHDIPDKDEYIEEAIKKLISLGYMYNEEKQVFIFCDNGNNLTSE